MSARAVLVLAVAGCATEPGESAAPARELSHAWVPVEVADARLQELDPPRLARRMSLDLRGVLPSADELDQVEADPGALAALRDAWMEDPHFEERLVQLFGERWHTQVDEFLITVEEFPELAADSANEYPWERAVGQEPLRLMARVAAEDRPWSEIVTSDTTMADEYLGASWPVDYPDGATGWREVRYTDGRPAAGVLATNGLWFRYFTTFTNYNRMRVSALTRLLLCTDYLSRPVTFNGAIRLSDAAGQNPLTVIPYCQGCHSAIDPIAASFFGFWTPQQYNGTENVTYHGERELLGADLLDVTPAWYGSEVHGLADLGAHIGADPRFARCTATSVTEMYLRREVVLDDFERVEAARQALVEGGTLKPAIRTVLDSAPYRAASAEGDGVDENSARLVDLTLLSSMLADIAGFRWSYAGFDQLDNDTWGYRILGGGVDGLYVTRPDRLPGLTWTLVTARVAEVASLAAVERDLGGAPPPAPLIAGYVQGDDGQSASFAAAARAARWRLLARRATDEELAEDGALFDAVGQGDAQVGWAAVLQALFRDPDFLSY